MNFLRCTVPGVRVVRKERDAYTQIHVTLVHHERAPTLSIRSKSEYQYKRTTVLIHHANRGSERMGKVMVWTLIPPSTRESAKSNTHFRDHYRAKRWWFRRLLSGMVSLV